MGPVAYRVRPARADDEPFLAAMLELAANWREPEPGRQPNPVEPHYVQDFGRPADIGVIAESDEGPAGAAWCRVLVGADRGYGYVADDIPELVLAVAPEHRGRGLGSSLIDALKVAAAGAGFRALSLSVEPENPSRRIYERAGFARCGTHGGSWTMIAEL